MGRPSTQRNGRKEDGFIAKGSKNSTSLHMMDRREKRKIDLVATIQGESVIPHKVVHSNDRMYYLEIVSDHSSSEILDHLDKRIRLRREDVTREIPEDVQIELKKWKWNGKQVSGISDHLMMDSLRSKTKIKYETTKCAITFEKISDSIGEGSVEVKISPPKHQLLQLLQSDSIDRQVKIMKLQSWTEDLIEVANELNSVN